MSDKLKEFPKSYCECGAEGKHGTWWKGKPAMTCGTRGCLKEPELWTMTTAQWLAKHGRDPIY